MTKNTLNNTVYPISNDENIKCCEYLQAMTALHFNSSIKQRTLAIQKFSSLAKNGEKKAWARIYDIFKIYAWEEMQNYISPEALVSSKLSHYHIKIYGIDSKIAFRCLNKGAILGDEYAQGWLALEYRGSIYGHQNSPASIKWLRIAALNGCVASQYNLAITLLKNFAAHEVKQEVSSLYRAIQAYRKSNPEKAVRFMEQAMQDLKSYIS